MHGFPAFWADLFGVERSGSTVTHTKMTEQACLAVAQEALWEESLLTIV